MKSCKSVNVREKRAVRPLCVNKSATRNKWWTLSEGGRLVWRTQYELHQPVSSLPTMRTVLSRRKGEYYGVQYM